MSKQKRTKPEQGPPLQVIPVTPPFGLTDTCIIVYSNGDTVYHWRLRWWYAIYQAFKMCFSPEMYLAHTSTELEENKPEVKK